MITGVLVAAVQCATGSMRHAAAVPPLYRPAVQTLVAEILAAWRRAERLSSELEPGTIDHAAAAEACERLRALYQDLTRSTRVGAVSEADARALLSELAANS